VSSKFPNLIGQFSNLPEQLCIKCEEPDAFLKSCQLYKLSNLIGIYICDNLDKHLANKKEIELYMDSQLELYD